MNIIITTLLLAAFLVAVCYCDMRYNRIYNYITVPFIAVAFAANILVFGLKGIYTSAGGLVVGFLILLLPFLWGWIGGGDVKFLAAAGTLLGARLILYSALAGLILAGIGAIFRLARTGRLKSFLQELKTNLLFLLQLGAMSRIEASGTMPLGLFLSIGILGCWIYFNIML